MIRKLLIFSLLVVLAIAAHAQHSRIYFAVPIDEPSQVDQLRESVREAIPGFSGVVRYDDQNTPAFLVADWKFREFPMNLLARARGQFNARTYFRHNLPDSMATSPNVREDERSLYLEEQDILDLLELHRITPEDGLMKAEIAPETIK